MNPPVLRVEKRLRVVYARRALNCERTLRVLPPEAREGQRVRHLEWQSTPHPDTLRESRDEFGNRVLHLRHNCIAREWRFVLRFEAEVETLGVALDIGLPPTGIGAFLMPSALCDGGTLIRQTARGFDDAPPEQLAAQICAWTFGHLRYDAGTTGHLSASHALQARRGMCQEFAHVMIALCRARGLAARYVSGFCRGEGLMHAWVEVACGAHWLAFDPTHGRSARPDCIVVGTGRDWRDVVPSSGSYRGASGAQLFVSCRVMAILRGSLPQDEPEA